MTVICRVPVEELAVFSLDNNPHCVIGEVMGDGVLFGYLPWTPQSDCLSTALDFWQTAQTVARILGGGQIGLAALMSGAWVHIDPDSLLSD